MPLNLKPCPTVQVRDNPIGCSPLITATREILETRVQKWLRDEFHTVRAAREVRNSPGCLSVMVSEQQTHRALRILDALIRALASRGISVEFGKGQLGYGSEVLPPLVLPHFAWL